MSRHTDPGALEEWGDTLPLGELLRAPLASHCERTGVRQPISPPPEPTFPRDPLHKFAAMHVPSGGFNTVNCYTSGCTIAATTVDDKGQRWCPSCAADIADDKREEEAAKADADYIARMKKAPYHPFANPYGVNPDEFGGSDFPEYP